MEVEDRMVGTSHGIGEVEGVMVGYLWQGRTR
jgi:hypothetical protein